MMVKKFNEFLEEGFMSRMVDTVYNDEPKKENDTIIRKVAIVILKWMYNCDIKTAGFTVGTLNKYYFKMTDQDKSKRLADMITKINGVCRDKNAFDASLDSFYDPDLYAQKLKMVSIFHGFDIGVCKELFDLLVKMNPNRIKLLKYGKEIQ